MITQIYPSRDTLAHGLLLTFKVSTVTSGAGKQVNLISQNQFASLNASLFTMQQRFAHGWKLRNTTNPRVNHEIKNSGLTASGQTHAKKVIR